MSFINVSSGLKKMYIAELLTIISGLSIFFSDGKMIAIGITLAFLGLVAFFVTLSGLKQCALNEPAYKKPFRFTIAGILVCVAVAVLGEILNNPVLSDSTNEIQGVVNYLIVYMVLQITAEILQKCGKESEAAYAKKLRHLYTFAFILSEILSITSDRLEGEVAVAIILAVAAVSIVTLLIAQIRYIIFLKKSSNALAAVQGASEQSN